MSVSRQPKSPRLNEEEGGDCRLLNCFLLAPSSFLGVFPNDNDRKYQPDDDDVVHSRSVYIQKPGNSSLPSRPIFHCSCRKKKKQTHKIRNLCDWSLCRVRERCQVLRHSFYPFFFIFPVLINKIHLFAAWLLLLLLFTKSKDRIRSDEYARESEPSSASSHTALSLVSSIDCAQHNSERKSAAYQPPL